MEIIRVRRGPDPDLIIRQIDGYHGAIAASWTTYTAVSDERVYEKPALLDLEGLLLVAHLVEQLAQRDRIPLEDQV